MKKAKKVLEVHNKLEVEIESRQDVYKSVITELDLDKETFSMEVPKIRRIPLRLSKEDEVEITVFTESVLYKFKTSVIGVKMEKEIPMYVLRINPEMEKMERRNFFRVAACLDVKYEILEESQINKWETVKTEKNATTSDVSGGGMQLTLDEDLPEGTLLTIKFTICDDKKTPIRVVGKIVKLHEEILVGSYYKYKVGVCFEKIQESDREELIEYIFSEMRKKMRRLME